MGVRGLKTYVNTLLVGEGEVWVKEVLSDTKVIIDGHGFCYHIYTPSEIEFKYGGEYDKVKNKTIEFFTMLRKNKVRSYVVFDGIMAKGDKKFDTRKKRKEERIKKVKRWCNDKLQAQDMVLPLLVQLTVLQVLREMQVPYAIADFEADCEIASLANKLNAPVMAEDTDFCIFDINRGYIPFSETAFSDETITVTKFNHNVFTERLGIDPSMLPLFASLMGNDYVTYEMLRPITVRMERSVSSPTPNPRGKKFKVRAIAQFLLDYRSRLEDATSDVKNVCSNENSAFKTALDLSIDEYQMKRSNLIDYFHSGNLSSNMRTYSGHLLPEWIIKLYRRGLIASEGLSHLCSRKVLLPTQCEDVTMPTAQKCAKDLRWYYYYTLVLPFLPQELAKDKKITSTEFYRSKTKLSKTVKKIMANRVREVRDIQGIRKMSLRKRNAHLLRILHCDRLSILPVKHQLVASALRYWVSHASVKPAHLAALLVHYVGEKQSSPTSTPPQVTIEAVHGFSEWQNVLYWVERLNALFHYCSDSNVRQNKLFCRKFKVTKLYNGVHVCNLYEKLQVDGIKAESIVADVDVYRDLYRAITEDLPDDCYFKLTKETPSCLEGNRFAPLFEK